MVQYRSDWDTSGPNLDLTVVRQSDLQNDNGDGDGDGGGGSGGGGDQFDIRPRQFELNLQVAEYKSLKKINCSL